MCDVFSCPLHFLPSHSHSFLCCRGSIFSRAFHAVVSGALRVDSSVQPKRFKAIMWRSLQLKKEKRKTEPVPHCTKLNSKGPGNKIHPFILWRWCCKTGNKNQAVLTSCTQFLLYSSVGFVLLGGTEAFTVKTICSDRITRYHFVMWKRWAWAANSSYFMACLFVFNFTCELNVKYFTIGSN